LVLSLLLSTPIAVRGCGGSGGRAHAGCKDAPLCLDDFVPVSRLSVQSRCSSAVLQLHLRDCQHIYGASILLLAGATAAEKQAVDRLDHRSHAGKRVLMKPDTTQSLDRLLESAVVQSWPDLMQNATSGLLHLEYVFAPDNSLDSLKLWSSTVWGQWNLVCEYWMSSSAFHDKGIHFKDGFQSEDLSHTLEFIMQHQHTFSPLPNLGRTGLLQIQVPTGGEPQAAATSLSEAFCRVNSFSAEPCIA
jgi:hypothetical protein